MGAHRHGAQAVGEQEVEAGRPRRVDIEVMGRPVAGHLGVAAGRVLVDVVGDGSDRVGSGVVGEAVIGGHDARSATPCSREAPSSTTARRLPRHRRQPGQSASRPGCRPGMSAPPRSATRSAAVHRERVDGAPRCRVRRAPPRGHAAKPTPAGRPLPLRSQEHSDHRKHRGHCESVQHRGRRVAGSGGVGRNCVGFEATGERAMPDRGHRHLTHLGGPFCGANPVHSVVRMVTTFS